MRANDDDLGPVSRYDGVLEGGGSWGIAHVGTYAALYNRRFQPQRLAGTSAGAIVACLIAAGYTDPVELKKLVQEAFESHARNPNGWTDFLDTAAGLIRLGAHDGFCDTKAFHQWLTILLEKKNIRTFGDLRYDSSNSEKLAARYKLIVVASDVTLGRRIVWPRDAALYNMAPDDVPVADAVVMSMSIPLYFAPFRLLYRDHAGNMQTSLVVDGGLLSNYPVDLFDVAANVTPRWPTFGFRLSQAGKDRIHDTSNLLSFMEALTMTVIEGNADLDMDAHKRARTILIPTSGISPVDANLTQAQSDTLFKSGFDAADNFLATWDFKKYK